MKKLFISIGVLLLIGVFVFTFLPTGEDVEEIEDTSSYDINNRYECKQIETPEFYNECLDFYNSKTPYRLGDILLPYKSVQ